MLVAGAYTERRATISLFKYFPAALKVAQAFPKLPEIAAQFRAGGLELAIEDTVTGEVAAGLREAAARTALRADSTLQLISDEEFAAGQRALEEAAAAESEPKPIIDSIDLLVFRAPPGRSRV